MKKNTKREKTTFTAREVAVLLEDINSKIDSISDGHKLLNEKFDEMKSAFERFSTGVEKIDLRLIKGEKNITKNTADIATISARLDRIEQDIHFIKEDLGKRVSIIEAKVASLNNR